MTKRKQIGKCDINAKSHAGSFRLKAVFFSPRQTMTFVRPWTRYQTSSTYPEIILGEAEKDFNIGGGVHDDFEEVMRK